MGVDTQPVWIFDIDYMSQELLSLSQSVEKQCLAFDHATHSSKGNEDWSLKTSVSPLISPDSTKLPTSSQ